MTTNSKSEYMLVPQPGDREIILTELSQLEQLDNQQLVDAYNRQVDLGIIGSRHQSLRIFAIGVEFRKRFGESPVYLEDDIILGMQGKIRLEEAGWRSQLDGQ